MLKIIALFFTFSFWVSSIFAEASVQFEIISSEKMIKSLKHFINRDYRNTKGWSKIIYKNYPELNRRLEQSRNIEIEKYFQEQFKIKKELLLTATNKFQKDWNKINSPIIKALFKIHEIENRWDNITIRARVSLNPICPRFLEEKSFDVYYKGNANAISIHEISHFVFFEKWKQVFPKADPKKFNRPGLPWHLSEMVIAIILNDPAIQAIFPYKFHSYKIYEQTQINNRPLLYHLSQFYKNRKNFADFLKKSYGFIKTHENKIRSL